MMVKQLTTEQRIKALEALINELEIQLGHKLSGEDYVARPVRYEFFSNCLNALIRILTESELSVFHAVLLQDKLLQDKLLVILSHAKSSLEKLLPPKAKFTFAPSLLQRKCELRGYRVS